MTEATDVKNPFLVSLGERVRVLRARRGMTRKGGERGELYVRLLVRVPRTDDERAAELARALDAYY